MTDRFGAVDGNERRYVFDLCKALESNTTLVKLNLKSENQRKKTHKRHPSTNHFFSIIITTIDNHIGDIGTTSLSEALKLNTTLTKLNMFCGYERHTKDIYQQFALLFTTHKQGTRLEKREQCH